MRLRQARPPVLVSYAAFVLVGINVGISGVLLPAQMASYGVDRATIGIIFFTGSAGFVLASVSTGALIQRAGIRIALTAGGGATVAVCVFRRPAGKATRQRSRTWSWACWPRRGRRRS